MTAPDPITLASASGQPWTTVTPAAPAAGSGLVYAAGQPLASVASRIPPYAEAIGFAGATITLATVAMVSSDIAAALSAVTTGLRGQSVASFVTGAHPGDVSPNAPDPQLKQITIDWSHDQNWYMKANQDGATAH